MCCKRRHLNFLIRSNVFYKYLLPSKSTFTKHNYILKRTLICYAGNVYWSQFWCDRKQRFKSITMIYILQELFMVFTSLWITFYKIDMLPISSRSRLKKGSRTNSIMMFYMVGIFFLGINKNFGCFFIIRLPSKFLWISLLFYAFFWQSFI